MAFTFFKHSCVSIICLLDIRPHTLILPTGALPDHVPQILINRERLSYLTFDVELLGNCDDIVGDLCRRLGEGWEQLAAQGEPLTQVPLSDLPTPPVSPPSTHSSSAISSQYKQNEDSVSMLADRQANTSSSLAGDKLTLDTLSTSVDSKQTNNTSVCSNNKHSDEDLPSKDRCVDISSTSGENNFRSSNVVESSHSQPCEKVDNVVKENGMAAGDDPDIHGKCMLNEECASSTDTSVRKRAFAEIGKTPKDIESINDCTDVSQDSESQAKQMRLSPQTSGQSDACPDEPSRQVEENGNIEDENDMDSLENLRRMYQPKARISLATRLSGKYLINYHIYN